MPAGTQYEKKLNKAASGILTPAVYDANLDEWIMLAGNYIYNGSLWIPALGEAENGAAVDVKRIGGSINLESIVIGDVVKGNAVLGNVSLGDIVLGAIVGSGINLGDVLLGTINGGGVNLGDVLLGSINGVNIEEYFDTNSKAIKVLQKGQEAKASRL